jgi:hypothetical protein
MSDKGMKHNAEGEIVLMLDNSMTTPPAARRDSDSHGPDVVASSVAVVAVSSEKNCSTSTPTKEMDIAKDDDYPAVESPAFKNRPTFTSTYNFLNPKLKVLTGKLHLCYHNEDDCTAALSKLAYGAYCEICDDEFPYNVNTNPHTVTKHAREKHTQLMVSLREKQLERELADAKSKASFRINKQTTLTSFAHSEGSKFPLAGKSDLDKFLFKTAVWIGSHLLPFSHVEDPK